MKNVLITGGSRGIGFGIAKELARTGCNLAINGVRQEEQITEPLQELRSFGTRIIYCQGDVSSASDRDRMIKMALDKFGKLHVLVNNAGIGPKKRLDLLETNEESYDQVMGTNLKGPFFLTQKVAEHMIEKKSADKEFSGCIVNISSVSAVMASTHRGEYCISKAGMGMMTKLFAARLGEYKIPVYEVRPGIIETDMTAGVLGKYQKRIEKGLTVEPRLGMPEDVGRVVLALVQETIPYATGQVLTVDGGLSIPRL